MAAASETRQREKRLTSTSLLRSISIQNLLSFGPNAEPLGLGSLNVLIGPNGSGKSNLLHVLELLRSLPDDLDAHVAKAGGISEWLWKGDSRRHTAGIEVTMDARPLLRSRKRMLKYNLALAASLASETTRIVDENIWFGTKDDRGDPDWVPTYRLLRGRPVLSARPIGASDKEREDVKLKASDFSRRVSILAQLKGNVHYPEITDLHRKLDRISVYGVFDVGIESPLRRPELSIHLSERLSEDGSNLSSVLNALGKQTSRLEDIERRLRDFYPRVKSLRTEVLANTIQTVIHEQGLEHSIPTSRMSDGMLRYLCLLAILCQPDPPALICLEEPEAGLHPDIIPELAKLLQEASQRTQLIVTTHSDILVDALSETPEAIIVTERGENGTEFQRLDKNDLTVWLEKYSLGELWTRGHIGGNRW